MPAARARRSRHGLGVRASPGVFEEELEEVDGPGEPAECEGAELVVVVVVTHRLGEDLGHALDHGVDPGGVAGGDAGDEVAVAELVGAGEADVALVAGPFAFGAVGLGVGLDHLRSGDLEDGRGCVAADGLRDGAVHAADLLGEQGAGQHGDLAGDPRLAVAGLDDRPGERQPVDEVEPVGDQCPRRGGMGLADHRQLGDRVLAQRGSPVACRV